MRWGNSDLTHWLGGSVRNRELAETRQAWDATERAWRASPLASLEQIQLVLTIASDAADTAGVEIPTDFAVALATVADDLLDAESIGDVVADWPVIESDAKVAVDVRAMLARRKRWALDYDRLMRVLRERIVGAYAKLLSALPDDCFDDSGEEDAPFTVPLLSLIENPTDAIEALVMTAYDDAVFRYDLFHDLREQFASNYVIASGFTPTVNPHEVSDKLIPPSRHKSDDPTELADLYLGGTPFRKLLDFPIPFRVPESERFEHCHVVGGTGHGKTQLLQRMIHADLVAAKDDGRSVVVIDSQGDLISKLVRLDLFEPDAPDSLAHRLVVIDPADVAFPPSLNLFDVPKARFEGYSPADRERALNGLIELYETFFGALLGAELTQKQGVIFRYLARLMLAIPDATIHTLMQLMEDGKPFKNYMDALDGSARHFFATEFFHPSFSATKKQILKRLWGVLSTPAFERMFTQKDNKLDLFKETNRGAIILISTAKDLLKTEGSALFGRFFIAMLAQATLERSTLPERERTPTFLYVDEAQEYFDDTIETILSQARKYKVSITAAHQTLDQLSPRLRAAFLSNTSLKCVGGASSKDARALAPELQTSADFIESMRKRRDRTEFAVWLKGRTPSALRLAVPLGHLERQPTLSEESFDELIDINRARYCGTLDDVLEFASPSAPVAEAAPAAPPPPPQAAIVEPTEAARVIVPAPPSRPQVPIEDRPLGKGGPKHRYLQALVKELGEQQGFRATIEAPVGSGTGQVDVLLVRDDARIAFEVSVSTAVEQERENVRKCLAAGYDRVALLLAKSRATHGRYAAQVLDGLSADEAARVSVLAPEDLPDFIAALAPAPAPSESIVKGYRVRVSHASVSPEEARERRDRLAKVVARTMHGYE